MQRRIQLILAFLIFLLCIGATVNYMRNENNRKNEKDEVYNTIQDEIIVENTDVYIDFLKNYNTYGEEYYYSYIELDNYNDPVLLLSDGVYKNGDNRYVAMCTDIFYPINNKVTLFGNICSNGTAYPISANTTGIYTAGGHEVAKYNLDIQSLNLKLISNYIMFFHKTGEEVKAITIEIIGEKNRIVSEDKFDEAYIEYANAQIIYFKRLSDNNDYN